MIIEMLLELIKVIIEVINQSDQTEYRSNQSDDRSNKEVWSNKKHVGSLIDVTISGDREVQLIERGEKIFIPKGSEVYEY